MSPAPDALVAAAIIEVAAHGRVVAAELVAGRDGALGVLEAAQGELGGGGYAALEEALARPALRVCARPDGRLL